VLADSPAFSGFSVDDPDKARAFHEEALGLPVAVVEGARGSALRLELGSGADLFLYTKDAPAGRHLGDPPAGQRSAWSPTAGRCSMRR
jgi:hypothetical protein